MGAIDFRWLSRLGTGAPNMTVTCSNVQSGCTFPASSLAAQRRKASVAVLSTSESAGALPFFLVPAKRRVCRAAAMRSSSKSAGEAETIAA